jgi:hypothetical protein
MGLHPVSMKKFSVLVEMVSFAGWHPTLIEFDKVWGSLTYVGSFAYLELRPDV